MCDIDKNNKTVDIIKLCVGDAECIWGRERSIDGDEHTARWYHWR